MEKINKNTKSTLDIHKSNTSDLNSKNQKKIINNFVVGVLVLFLIIVSIVVFIKTQNQKEKKINIIDEVEMIVNDNQKYINENDEDVLTGVEDDIEDLEMISEGGDGDNSTNNELDLDDMEDVLDGLDNNQEIEDLFSDEVFNDEMFL